MPNSFNSFSYKSIKVALYLILQRFEYHICDDNFSFSKCFSIALGRRSIIKTYNVRLHTEDSFRTQMLLV